MYMKSLITITAILLAVHTNAQTSDSAVLFRLPNVDVNGGRNWSNDTIRYQYNQMKHYVTTILPYLQAATAMMDELNRLEQDPSISKRQRKSFINQKEDEMKQRFETEIKQLNETQGVLLVKLIARQSGENIYGKMEEYKTTFYALKWQAWARLHGFNLNRRYDPYDEPMLEHIMQSLGYPLPAKYGEYEARLTTY